MTKQTLMPAAGGIAFLAACTVGPRIAFERPNEGGGVDAIVREFKGLSTDVKAALEQAGVKANGLDERMNRLEQKMARSDGGDWSPAPPKSLGAKFIEQEGVKAFAANTPRNGRFEFETKATLTSSTANQAGAVGAAIQAFRDPTIVPLPQRRPIVRDLLTVVPMTGGVAEYVVQTGRANNAAMVAETQPKPGSDFKFELRNAPARVVAHFTKASRQVLDDIPQLQNIIDTELLEGLALKEESQILSGDGTGQNLLGLTVNAPAFVSPITFASPTMLDQIALAMLQTAFAQHPATGIILNPGDWTRITLLKDTAGNYIFGNPGTSVEQRLFGKPVVITEAIAVDKFLVGNFPRAATLYDRWTARIEIGTENDDFTRNLLTVLAEERIALAVKDPTALVYGDFGFVS
jgi:HK97 family phage major capsid protein